MAKRSNQLISSERLKELVFYDEGTGEFSRVASVKAKLGRIEGTRTGRGYLSVTLDRRMYLLHRLAWLYVHGDHPKGIIDHINGDKSNNRIANLRLVTASENAQNLHGPHRDNKSGYLGVTKCLVTGRWRAFIFAGGKQRALGRYDTPEEAHAAYMKAKAGLHPVASIVGGGNGNA